MPNLINDFEELHLDPEAAKEMAANAVVKYLRDCNLNGESKKRQWIGHLFDRVMAKEFSH